MNLKTGDSIQILKTSCSGNLISAHEMYPISSISSCTNHSCKFCTIGEQEIRVVNGSGEETVLCDCVVAGLTHRDALIAAGDGWEKEFKYDENGFVLPESTSIFSNFKPGDAYKVIRRVKALWITKELFCEFINIPTTSTLGRNGKKLFSGGRNEPLLPFLLRTTGVIVVPAINPEEVFSEVMYYYADLINFLLEKRSLSREDVTCCDLVAIIYNSKFKF